LKALLPVFALLGASVLWGLTWLPLKRFGEHGIEGPLVTLLAHGAVGLFAVPFLVARRESYRGRYWEMAVLVFFGGLANITFASAIVKGDVMRVMVLFYLLPAWGVLGGRFVLGERIDRNRALSLAFALSGAFLVLGGPAVLDAPPSFIDLLAVISGFALSANNVVFRKVQDVPVSTKVAAMFGGSLAWAMLVVLLDGSPAPSGVSVGMWTEVVSFGLVWILLATVGTLWGVNHMEAGRAAVLIIMELVTAVVSAAIIERTVPTPIACVGGVLILLSALLEGLRDSEVEASVAT
jgi:drug/metabolite transporter (DMT)-like permease